MFCGIKSYNNVGMLSFGIDTGPQSFFLPLPIIRCSKSAQKSAVQVCQVATVVMETVQLVLSQFENLLPQPIEN